MLSIPTALVTGGSRGIGRGICQRLSRAGYAVAVNYQGNEAAACETQASLASENMLCQADVALAADRDRMVDAVLEKWGRLDVLVNNAGITSVGRLDLLDATEESWDRVLATNTKGPFFLTQRAAREMLRLKDSLPNPAIVNITSVSAYALSTNRGDYCISKAALSLAGQLWALRLADHGIRVYEIRPGIIESDMTAAAQEKYSTLIADGLTPIRRWGTPDDIGAAVVSLVRGDFPFSTGEIVNIDGGFHLRAFPR